jgi:hypothetical protein
MHTFGSVSSSNLDRRDEHANIAGMKSVHVASDEDRSVRLVSLHCMATACITFRRSMRQADYICFTLGPWSIHPFDTIVGLFQCRALVHADALYPASCKLLNFKAELL